jgi:exodeoxyribonuclease VIII
MFSKEVEKQIEDLAILADSGDIDGTYSNISDEVYHNCIGLSRSDLQIVRTKSVQFLGAKKRQEWNTETSPSMEFGTAFHTYMLEPKRFDEIYDFEYDVPRPEGDARKTEANGGIKEQYKEWQAVKAAYEAARADKKLMKPEVRKQFRGMMRSCLNNQAFKELYQHSDTLFEQVVFFTCPNTGILQKFKADIINPTLKIICDLKTSVSASPKDFARSVASYFYDLQAAQYLKGAEQIYGGKWTFAFMVAEKTAPYASAGYTVNNDMRNIGEELMTEILTDLKENMGQLLVEDNYYHNGFVDIEVPAYHYYR